MSRMRSMLAIVHMLGAIVVGWALCLKLWRLASAALVPNSGTGELRLMRECNIFLRCKLSFCFRLELCVLVPFRGVLATPKICLRTCSLCSSAACWRSSKLLGPWNRWPRRPFSCLRSLGDSGMHAYLLLAKFC